jgi:hypothetical protein
MKSLIKGNGREKRLGYTGLDVFLLSFGFSMSDDIGGRWHENIARDVPYSKYIVFMADACICLSSLKAFRKIVSIICYVKVMA